MISVFGVGLNDASIDAVWRNLSAPTWGYGWISNIDKTGFPFWHKHFAGSAMPDHKEKVATVDCRLILETTNPTICHLWHALAKDRLRGHTLLRCYANGMTYGCDGTVHTDSTDPDSFTVVYYANPKWDQDWGGETALFPHDAPAYWALPQPGRFLMFNGTIPHVARGVSRLCPVMRVTLMFKTRLPRL